MSSEAGAETASDGADAATDGPVPDADHDAHPFDAPTDTPPPDAPEDAPVPDANQDATAPDAPKDASPSDAHGDAPPPDVPFDASSRDVNADAPSVEDANDAAATDAAGDGPAAAPMLTFAAAYGSDVRWIGDFDADGKLDLAGIGYPAAQTDISIWRGRGDGTFLHDPVITHGIAPPRPFRSGVADLNGDHRADLTILDWDPTLSNDQKQRPHTYHGQRDGTLIEELAAPPTSEYHWPPHCDLTAGDFNGDSWPDLLYPAINGNIDASGAIEWQILTEWSPGMLIDERTFDSTAEAKAIPAIAVGDFNGDTHLDQAIVAEFPFSPSGVLLTLGLGSGYFPQYLGSTPSRPLLAGTSGALDLVAGDFDRDGHTDLVVARATGVQPFWGDGHGQFVPGTTLLPAQHVDRLLSGDFDGDGLPDLLVAGAAPGPSTILYGEGDRGFARTAPVILPMRPDDLGRMRLWVGDVNGDGLSDVISGGSPAFVYLAAIHPITTPDIDCRPLPDAQCARP